MKEEQFDPLDEAMRQAAEFYEPPFDEAAWQKMNALLDANDKRRRRVLGWWWLPDMATLLVMGMFLMAGGYQPKPALHQASEQGNRIPAAGKEPVQQGAEKTIDNSYNVLPPADLALVAEAETRQNIRSLNPAKGGKMNAPVYKTKGWDQGNDASGIRTNTRGNATIADAALAVREAGILPAKTEENTVAEGGILVVENQAGADGDSVVVIARPLAGNDSPATLTDSTVLPKEPLGKPISQRKKSWTSRFSITGLAGAETTWANGDAAGNPAFLYGGLLGYTTGRFTFQAGVQSAMKLYTASGDDYIAKPGSYWSYVTLQKVDAECRVLEIPLLVRYDFGAMQKGHFFLSGGVASAIMEQEEYYYDYKRMNGQQAYSNYEYSTGNVHWLSSAVLSAGYAKPLHKRLAFSVQSFYKLPLKGIGEGSIRIQSFGLQAGLTYYPF